APHLSGLCIHNTWCPNDLRRRVQQPTHFRDRLPRVTNGPPFSYAIPKSTVFSVMLQIVANRCKSLHRRDPAQKRRAVEETRSAIHLPKSSTTGCPPKLPLP